MIKITNGVNVFTVTRGAYEGIYRRQGYKPYDQSVVDAAEQAALDNRDVAEQVAAEPAAPEEPQLTPEELFCKEVEEKPIAQWTKDEVKEYAGLKKIDLTGTKNPGEAKERIKAFMAK